MKQETKILLDEYKAEFQNYKTYIDSNTWFDNIEFDKNGNMFSNKLNIESSIINTVIKSITKFKEDVEQDLGAKQVKSFITYTSNIIKRHIERMERYKKLHPLCVSSVECEVKFHSDLFAKITKGKIDLAKLNIDETDKKSLNLFYSGVKAPLLMREYLCGLMPEVSERTKALDIDFSASHVNPATSNEMLCNMNPKDIPEWDLKKHFFEQDLSTIQFWEEERIKMLNGINIGGYHIHPWLYWHLNVFKMAYGAGVNKKMRNPQFRDNEYYFTEMLKKAEEHGRVGLLLYGSRRISKSTVMASFMQKALYTIPNAKCTVLGFTKIPDLKAITDYITESITNIYPALRINANNADVNSGITLGLKRTAQDRYDFSDLTFINLEEGSKTGSQKPAASTPDAFALDEALKWNEKVFTKRGFKNIKDVVVGEYIYGADGKLTKILDKIDVGIKQLYKFTFSDGSVVEACGDHLWGTYNKNGNYKVLKTTELIEKITNTNKFYIPVSSPIHIEDKELPIDPYLVGYLIGDGGLTDYRVDISFSPEDEENVIRNIKPELDRFECIIKKSQKSRIRLNNNKKLRNEIVKLGLNKPSWEKDIPDIYKLASINQRIELLKGLLDSDGCCYVGKSGSGKFKSSITFTTTSEKLKNSLRYLCSSLGIISTSHSRIRERNGVLNRRSWEIILQTDLNLFKIKRKSDKIIKRINGNPTKIRIVSIDKSSKDKAYCIKVDNDSKLFITTDFIVTHNCGKGDSLSVWDAAKPSFAGGENDRWRIVPLLSGTAGAADLSKSAESMLKDPVANDILPMDWDLYEDTVEFDQRTWVRESFGFFVPAQLSLEAPDKEEKTFAQFLKKGSDSELNSIKIMTTRWNVANEFFKQKRKNKSSDLSLLAREMNSFPLEVDDCYLTTEQNKFPAFECKKRKKDIETRGELGEKYRLSWNHFDLKVDTQMVPMDAVIDEYPYNGKSIDAPVVMLENPNLVYQDYEPPLGLYCIGFDDAKQDKTSGDSVLSATVFKRGYEGGEWANRIVAYYDSRPERKKTYYQTLHLLIKLYNARFLHENEDNGFIEWLEEKHQEDLFKHVSNGIGLATEENLNRNQNRRWGWSPTPNNIYHLEQRQVRYTTDDNVVIGSQDGLMGTDRINHPMLLEEYYKYKPKQNADRIRSFGLALTLASYYDKSNQYMKLSRPRKVETDDYKPKHIKTAYKGLTDTSKLRKW